MTSKQALAYAKHELERYKKVERDGIKITNSIEFYEIVVTALERMGDKMFCNSCKYRSEADYRRVKAITFFYCMRHHMYTTLDSSCEEK